MAQPRVTTPGAPCKSLSASERLTLRLRFGRLLGYLCAAQSGVLSPETQGLFGGFGITAR